MRLLLILLLVSFTGMSQPKLTDLDFNTDYYRAVNQWIAFPKVSDEPIYNFGYIYLDVHSGFMYKYESKFKIENKKIARVKNDTTVGFVKFKLVKDIKKVSVLNEVQVKALDLPEQPDWLTPYKKGQDEVKFLVKKGYYFNAAGASDLAMPYLEKAYDQEPHYQGLEFELGYAYNAEEKFEKALEVMEKAVDNDPINVMFYKELGYAHENLNQIEEAEKAYNLGIRLAEDASMKISLAIRMVQYYYNTKQKSKFQEWADKMLSFSENNPEYQKYITSLMNQWDTE